MLSVIPFAAKQIGDLYLHLYNTNLAVHRDRANPRQSYLSKGKSGMVSSRTPGVAHLTKGNSVDLRPHGLVNTGQVFANLSAPALTEHVITRNEAVLTDLGAVAAYTGK
jgi:hypothetical protein